MESSSDILSCGHDNYQVYCQNHDKVLCLDCALSDHQNCGGQKAKTLKVAVQDLTNKYEEILQLCKQHQDQCAQMQLRVANQVSLEDEILAKVDEEFSRLKGIIDEKKDDAKTKIRNLESVQNYKPPPQNFTVQTLEQLNGFSAEVEKSISWMKI